MKIMLPLLFCASAALANNLQAVKQVEQNVAKVKLTLT